MLARAFGRNRIDHVDLDGDIAPEAGLDAFADGRPTRGSNPASGTIDTRVRSSDSWTMAKVRMLGRSRTT